MIRKIFKKKQSNGKIKDFISKYKIPREYLSINRKAISRGVFILDFSNSKLAEASQKRSNEISSRSFRKLE